MSATFNNICTNNLSVTAKLSGMIIISFGKKWVQTDVSYSLKQHGAKKCLQKNVHQHVNQHVKKLNWIGIH